jgi:hypothetical protein
MLNTLANRPAKKWRFVPSPLETPRFVKRSWEYLGKAVLRAAKVSGENLEPNSEKISAALKRLESNVQFMEGLVRSIRNLQEIARKVYYHSKWAYDPSPEEGVRYVLCCCKKRTRR